jgi:hypothetical protein
MSLLRRAELDRREVAVYRVRDGFDQQRIIVAPRNPSLKVGAMVASGGGFHGQLSVMSRTVGSGGRIKRMLDRILVWRRGRRAGRQPDTAFEVVSRLVPV